MIAAAPLNKPRTIANVRSNSFSHSQRTPSTSSSRHDRRVTTALDVGGVKAIVEINAAETTNDPASRRNGTAKPAASSSDPSGGPANWLATSWAAQIRPLAFSS